MNDTAIRKALEQAAGDTPPSFHRAMQDTLARIAAGDAAPIPRPRRMARRALALAVLMALLVGAACALYRFTTFDQLSFLTGENPANAGQVMTAVLHTETVNGVEISIREAGYDGRILFLQYVYRLPDIDRPLTGDDESLLDDYNVGWWVDHFWIDGQCMPMFGGSGSTTDGTGAPGELVRTEYWRLDEGGVQLSGRVEIALPIGAKPDPARYFPRSQHPEWYDENGDLKQPDQGLVRFTLDAGDLLSRVVTHHPQGSVTNALGAFRVSEAAFSPLMTYITLSIQPDPAALAAYQTSHSRGYEDEHGEPLLWPYEPVDAHGDWVFSLALVDAQGRELFPGHSGCSMVGNEQAEFLYPCISPLPSELWLAPVEDGQADMAQALRVW